MGQDEDGAGLVQVSQADLSHVLLVQREGTGRPRDQLIKIVRSAALLQNPHVMEGRLSAHLSFKRLSHERSTTWSASLRNCVVAKGDHVVGESDGDLNRRTAMIPRCIS